MDRRKFLATGAAAGMTIGTQTLGVPYVWANAGKWPSKEITYILPVSPGGANDLQARAVLAKVSKMLGVPVIIKNMPGGSATLGVAALAKSVPDGYTLGNPAISAILIAPHLMKVPYALQDFDLIASPCEPLYGLGVGAKSPITSVDDIVKVAKSRRVTVASNTIVNIVCMMQLGALTKGDFQWVPTKSQAEATTMAAGGHADCALQSAPELSALIESGDLRLLASANLSRWRSQPEVRTFQELGYPVANTVPLGYAGPAGLDAGIKAKLEQVILAAADDSEVKEQFEKIGVVANPLNSVKFKQTVDEMRPIIEKVLIDAGMKKT